MQTIIHLNTMCKEIAIKEKIKTRNTVYQKKAKTRHSLSICSI